MKLCGNDNELLLSCPSEGKPSNQAELCLFFVSEMRNIGCFLFCFLFSPSLICYRQKVFTVCAGAQRRNWITCFVIDRRYLLCVQEHRESQLKKFAAMQNSDQHKHPGMSITAMASLFVKK